MRKDFRETWDSEQWVIDRLVEAVEAGEAHNKRSLATQLLKGYSEHDWHLRDVIDAGVILPHEMLDAKLARLEDIIDVLQDGNADISDARLAELSSGADMTESEVAIWRDYIIDRAFDPELVFERGQGSICVVFELKHSDRRRAHLAIQDWDGQSGELVAVYSTYTEAINALMSTGMIRMSEGLAWEIRMKIDSRYR